MGELAASDLEAFTGGRLPVTDETERMVKAALARARRFCGWAVTPVQTDVDMVLDGPGTRNLSLPTMNLTGVSRCVEDGVDLDVSLLKWSRQGIVTKRTGASGQRVGHRWSNEFGAIRITVTHGYTEDEAADFRDSVLRVCDLAAQQVGPTMQQYRVDDVIRVWFKPGSPVLTEFEPFQLMGVA